MLSNANIPISVTLIDCYETTVWMTSVTWALFTPMRTFTQVGCGNLIKADVRGEESKHKYSRLIFVQKKQMFEYLPFHNDGFSSCSAAR